MTRIFLTGITGYVGGQVLHTLSRSASKDIKIAGLLRDATKASQIKTLYSNLDLIIGDLDDEALITKEASQSDIVLHLASTSHIPSAKAIAQGLQERNQQTKKPGYWIQISGATCYAAEEIAHSNFGHASNVQHDDISDKAKILSTLRNNPKRVVENTLLSQKSSAVRTALIIGPLIYGVGQGPGHQRSVQAPEIARATLDLGHAFKLEEGENVWSNVHVEDLAGLIGLLVHAAIEGKDEGWNEDGVYNVENGSKTFGALNAAIADEAYKQGLIKEDSKARMETIDAKKADSLSGHAAILWGTNARAVASKARKELGWKPSGPSLEDTIPDLVRREAEAANASAK